MEVDDRKAFLVKIHTYPRTPKEQLRMLRFKFKEKGFIIDDHEIAGAMKRYYERRLETEIACLFKPFDMSFLKEAKILAYRQAFQPEGDKVTSPDSKESSISQADDSAQRL